MKTKTYEIINALLLVAMMLIGFFLGVATHPFVEVNFAKGSIPENITVDMGANMIKAMELQNNRSDVVYVGSPK